VLDLGREVEEGRHHEEHGLVVPGEDEEGILVALVKRACTVQRSMEAAYRIRQILPYRSAVRFSFSSTTTVGCTRTLIAEFIFKGSVLIS